MSRDWISCVFALLGLAGCAPPEAKPSASADTSRTASTERQVGGREDTVAIFVHEVRASRKAQYDSAMGEIWGTALRKAAASKPYWRQTLSAARDFVPVANTTDAIYTYVYLVAPAAAEDTVTAMAFPKTLLLDAGYSDRAADSLSKRFEASVARTSGYFLVERKF